MIKKLLITFFIFGTSYAAYADSFYEDPNGRYRLPVPNAWQVTSQENGVSVIMGSAFASLMRVYGTGTPRALVEAIGQQFTSQWKNFDGANSSDCTFGNQPGFCAWFTGTNMKGVKSVLQIAGTTDADSGYVLFTSAPREEFKSLEKTFENIKNGFELTRHY